MRILGISGSLRKNSLNTLLLKNAAKIFPKGFELEIQPISNLPLYSEDLDTENKPTEVASFINNIAQADAILFATPEYNHGTSGCLKNAIDWASRPAFKSCLQGKLCGIISASKSPVGGARGQADLKNILSSTLSVVHPSIECLFSNAHTLFDDSQLVDENAVRHLTRYITNFSNWIQSHHQKR